MAMGITITTTIKDITTTIITSILNISVGIYFPTEKEKNNCFPLPTPPQSITAHHGAGFAMIPVRLSPPVHSLKLPLKTLVANWG